MKQHPGIFYIGLWGIIFLTYLGLRSHTFIAPSSHDEGLFLYAGQAWAHGELPYRDFWDHKPPGTFLFLSLPFRLFPFSLVAVKGFQCLVLSLSALLLYLLCQKHFHRSTCFTVLAFYIFYTSMPYTIRTGGLTEENALLFVVLSFYFILKERGSFIRHCFWAGLFLGIAIQFRQTFFLSSPFLFGVIIHHGRSRNAPPNTYVLSLLFLMTGMIIPEAIASFYFLWHGAWWDYVEASYLFNLGYIQAGQASLSFPSILTIQKDFIFSTGPYLLAPVFSLCVYPAIPKTVRWMMLPLLMTFAGDALAISLSGEYYEHYYVQAAVSIHLLLACFLEAVLQSFRIPSTIHTLKPWGLRMVSLLLSLIAFGLTLSGIKTYSNNFQGILEVRADEESPYAFQHDIACTIHQLTEPDERILLLGRDPNSVYIRSRRYAGSRFYHFSPLWKEKTKDAVTAAHEKAFFDDVFLHRPAILLLGRRSSRVLQEDRDFIQKLNLLLKEHYTLLDDWVEPAPEDVWFWYGPVTLWIRNDLQDRTVKRYAEIISSKQQP